MGKSNKKGLLVIGAIAFVSFLYLQSGDTGGQKAVIKRAYTLKGILIQTPLLAVIVDASGESHIVGKGEHFNGMAVVSIERDRAILKDAYGTFTLIQK